MKTDFHNKDFALSLALKWRQRWTRKWPILVKRLILFSLKYQEKQPLAATSWNCVQTIINTIIIIAIITRSLRTFWHVQGMCRLGNLILQLLTTIIVLIYCDYIGKAEIHCHPYTCNLMPLRWLSMVSEKMLAHPYITFNLWTIVSFSNL